MIQSSAHLGMYPKEINGILSIVKPEQSFTTLLSAIGNVAGEQGEVLPGEK